jgi:hypothetical protein
MNFNRMDMRNIAFDYISNRFAKGKYLGIEVTIDMDTGYINGPHLVAQAKTKGGEPKRFDNWKANKEAKDLIQYLSTTGIVGPTGITGDRIFVEIIDVPNELKGTYVHPRLIPHLAQWASPMLADKVAIIINEHVITEALKAKDLLITSLEKSNKELHQKIDELLQYAKNTQEDNDRISNQLENITTELEDTSANNEKLVTAVNAITEKLDIATDQRVPPHPMRRCNEVLLICQRPNTPEFRMVRRQKRTLGTGIQACRADGFTYELYRSDSPNAVNLGARFKDILPQTYGRVSGTSITLANGKTAQDLLDFIRRAEAEKKSV